MKSPFLSLLLLALGLLLPPLHARLLDDFDDEQKTGWEDFSFQAGFGLPVEEDGQFKFVQPAAGTSIFSASTKVSETFTLQEGRRLVFSVDLVGTNGADAFAVLSFIPKSSSVAQLAGYSLAKSATDCLLVKGINKYFYNEHVEPEVNNENVTLVLTLTVKNGRVHINGRVLDKDDGNAVIFEQSAVDTPAADPLVNGTDDPAAPYLGEGNFVLLCYQDDGRTQETYEVTFDNAEVYVLDEVVVDDFNDNVKSQWTDFTFVPGLGLPVEENGQFKFVQPAAGQSIFSASTKSSPSFELVEGEQLQFRVDLAGTNGNDAFAVLSFIPAAAQVSQLAGYSLALSPSDVLVTKGINKYFYEEGVAETEGLRSENVALALTLTAKNGNVIITGQVLDLADNDAVLFEFTAVDTPGADPLARGTDDPASPYLGAGNFVLLCYQDDGRTQETYEVTYDNAVAWRTATTANAAPTITEIEPPAYRNFLPAATTVIRFKASDDQPLDDASISITLNGTAHTTANGLTLSGPPGERVVSLGGFEPDTTYTAVLRVVDGDGAERVERLSFDTFAADSFVIEVEDYNFEAGNFWDNPRVIGEGGGPEDGAYANQFGEPGIDYFDTRTSVSTANAPYRNWDYVRMARSLDYERAKHAAAGGAEEWIFDYAVGDFQPGEWMNYTRTFPAGVYAVYLRQAMGNMENYTTVLEEVTGDPSQPEASATVRGTFRGLVTGFQYGNVPLTNAAGTEPVLLTLGGVQTLRLRQTGTVPDDAQVSQNYLVFIRRSAPPVAAAPLLITAVAYEAAPHRVTFTWLSEAGLTYKVEASPDLGADHWTTLAAAHPSQGTTTSYTETLPEGTTARYYRVVRE